MFHCVEQIFIKQTADEMKRTKTGRAAERQISQHQRTANATSTHHCTSYSKFSRNSTGQPFQAQWQKTRERKIEGTEAHW